MKIINCGFWHHSDENTLSRNQITCVKIYMCEMCHLWWDVDMIWTRIGRPMHPGNETCVNFDISKVKSNLTGMKYVILDEMWTQFEGPMYFVNGIFDVYKIWRISSNFICIKCVILCTWFENIQSINVIVRQEIRTKITENKQRSKYYDRK